MLLTVTAIQRHWKKWQIIKKMWKTCEWNLFLRSTPRVDLTQWLKRGSFWLPILYLSPVKLNIIVLSSNSNFESLYPHPFHLSNDSLIMRSINQLIVIQMQFKSNLFLGKELEDWSPFADKCLPIVLILSFADISYKTQFKCN